MTWSETSKDELNRPKGDEKGGSGAGTECTRHGHWAVSACRAGGMCGWKGSRGLKCPFRELDLILGVHPQLHLNLSRLQFLHVANGAKGCDGIQQSGQGRAHA